MAYLTDHWRGRHRLVQAFWFNTVLPSGVILALVRFGRVDLRFRQVDGETALVGGVLLAAWFAFSTWMIVGVWRSADRYCKARAEAGLPGTWGNMAQLLAMFHVCGLLFATANIGGNLLETLR